MGSRGWGRAAADDRTTANYGEERCKKKKKKGCSCTLNQALSARGSLGLLCN